MKYKEKIEKCSVRVDTTEYERRVDFMKRILKGMAEAAKKTAKASVNSASFFATYQPKEPDVLKKKETK